MNERMIAFAHRLQDDSFFLASAMSAYTKSENINESGLAAVLDCSIETLASVSLCRRPRPQPQFFRQDVNRIAERFDVRADALAEIVRRADALMEMQRAESAERGFLMAARDADPEQADERIEDARDEEDS